MSGNNLVNEMRSAKPSRPPSRFGIVDLALLLFAVVAVTALGYAGWRAFVRPPVAIAATQPPAPQASPVPVTPTVRVAWTEADTRACKARAAAANAAPLPPEAAFSQRSITDGFGGLATGVACRITTKPLRFCDPPEKAALVELVNDYLGRVDLLSAGLGLQGAPMAFAGALFGGEMAMGSSVYDAQRDGTYAFMRKYHQGVVDGLRRLARDGIVEARDFGSVFGTPSTISKMFDGISVAQHACG